MLREQRTVLRHCSRIIQQKEDTRRRTEVEDTRDENMRKKITASGISIHIGVGH